jgi:hypothetical protein
MLGSCCACAIGAAAHSAATRSARRALPVELVMDRNNNRETPRDEERTIDGQRTGTARSFPLWRLPSGPYSPPVDSIFGSGIPPGPNSWPPNIPPAYSVPRTLRHSVSPIRIAKQCDPFATYRRVSHSPASTICRCIAKQAARAPHGSGRPAWTAMPFRPPTRTSSR